MKVCVYLELDSLVSGKSGIATAVKNQKRALSLANIEAAGNPNDDFDIIHINTIGPKSLFLAKKMKDRGIKVIIHAHTTKEDFENSFKLSNKIAPFLKKYLIHFYNQADLILCPSEYTKKVLERYGIEKKIEVISNGIDIEQFNDVDKKRNLYREKYKLTGIVPFSVGHVFARKGVSTFINVAKKFPNTFVWYGDSFNRILNSAKVIDMAENSPENIIFTGYVDDITAAYSSGDIFFFPTHNENQGIVLLEAAVSKKPILIRDLPVFDEWIDGKTCLKAKDDEEFALKLKELIGNEKLRKDLGRNAHNFVIKEHDLKIVGEKLKNIYNGLLNEGHTTS